MPDEIMNALNILVVEDDALHARIIREALEDHSPSVNVHHVKDGELALDYLKGQGQYADRPPRRLPDLILLDLRLPRVDGLTVLREVRREEATRSIPVTIISTSERPVEISECYYEGANIFVSKPFDLQKFVKKVREIYDLWTETAEIPVPVTP